MLLKGIPCQTFIPSTPITFRSWSLSSVYSITDHFQIMVTVFSLFYKEQVRVLGFFLASARLTHWHELYPCTSFSDVMIVSTVSRLFLILQVKTGMTAFPLQTRKSSGHPAPCLAASPSHPRGRPEGGSVSQQEPQGHRGSQSSHTPRLEQTPLSTRTRH